MSRTPIPSPTPTQNFAPVVGISGSGATNPDAAVPRQSSGSGAGAVAINISPSASKLLISKDDISIDRNQRLGEGGFGVVYVGTLRGSTKVAVKTIKGDLDDRTMAAFVKEVANWEGLVQRNVLPLMAFCVSPPMMVMDLIEEGNMRKYLGARGWDQALGRRFLHDVACGMAYLHASGILHGDLKSLNVLVDGLRAVITDFGLSRVRLEVSKSTARTGNGMQGTPGFVPPEMLTGGVLKPPGDVYAFAMLCYEVVSKGRYPFDDLTNIAAVSSVAFERRRPVRPEGVPDAMWELMERAWAHEPLSRPDFVELEKETAKLM
ncbi:kinase-like domain-containing protein [Hyaloraphidium curvatum]|nr:kinase-like domain-containing protein [Hyaloraphidium curvatum]